VALVDVPLPAVRGALPEDVARFLRDAGGRIDVLFASHAQERPAGFVPSDAVRVYEVLRGVGEDGLATGTRFCEWGSGLGVATCLAALLGWDAVGIEIDARLVRAAEALAADWDLTARFACGTFLPEGTEALLDRVTDDLGFLLPGGASGWDELELDPDEVDVVFAFPWPAEDEIFAALFQRVAGEGALLLTYHGVDDVRLRRKVRRRARRGRDATGGCGDPVGGRMLPR
jgi:hypothetical protein